MYLEKDLITEDLGFVNGRINNLGKRTYVSFLPHIPYESLFVTQPTYNINLSYNPNDPYDKPLTGSKGVISHVVNLNTDVSSTIDNIFPSASRSIETFSDSLPRLDSTEQILVNNLVNEITRISNTITTASTVNYQNTFLLAQFNGLLNQYKRNSLFVSVMRGVLQYSATTFDYFNTRTILTSLPGLDAVITYNGSIYQDFDDNTLPSDFSNELPVPLFYFTPSIGSYSEYDQEFNQLWPDKDVSKPYTIYDKKISINNHDDFLDFITIGHTYNFNIIIDIGGDESFNNTLNNSSVISLVTSSPFFNTENGLIKFNSENSYNVVTQQHIITAATINDQIQKIQTLINDNVSDITNYLNLSIYHFEQLKEKFLSIELSANTIGDEPYLSLYNDTLSMISGGGIDNNIIDNLKNTYGSLTLGFESDVLKFIYYYNLAGSLYLSLKRRHNIIDFLNYYLNTIELSYGDFATFLNGAEERVNDLYNEINSSTYNDIVNSVTGTTEGLVDQSVQRLANKKNIIRYDRISPTNETPELIISMNFNSDGYVTDFMLNEITIDNIITTELPIKNINYSNVETTFKYNLGDKYINYIYSIDNFKNIRLPQNSKITPYNIISYIKNYNFFNGVKGWLNMGGNVTPVNINTGVKSDFDYDTLTLTLGIEYIDLSLEYLRLNDLKTLLSGTEIRTNILSRLIFREDLIELYGLQNSLLNTDPTLLVDVGDVLNQLNLSENYLVSVDNTVNKEILRTNATKKIVDSNTTDYLQVFQIGDRVLDAKRLMNTPYLDTNYDCIPTEFGSICNAIESETDGYYKCLGVLSGSPMSVNCTNLIGKYIISPNEQLYYRYNWFLGIENNELVICTTGGTIYKRYIFKDYNRMITVFDENYEPIY